MSTAGETKTEIVEAKRPRLRLPSDQKSILFEGETEGETKGNSSQMPRFTMRVLEGQTLDPLQTLQAELLGEPHQQIVNDINNLLPISAPNSPTSTPKALTKDSLRSRSAPQLRNEIDEIVTAITAITATAITDANNDNNIIPDIISDGQVLLLLPEQELGGFTPSMFRQLREMMSVSQNEADIIRSYTIAGQRVLIHWRNQIWCITRNRRNLIWRCITSSWIQRPTNVYEKSWNFFGAIGQGTMDGFSDEISLAVNGARLAVNVGTVVAPHVGAFGRSLGRAAGYIGRVAVVTAWATGGFLLGELVRAAGGGGGGGGGNSHNLNDDNNGVETKTHDNRLVASSPGGDDPNGGSNTETTQTPKKKKPNQTEIDQEKARRKEVRRVNAAKRMADSKGLTDKGKEGNIHFNDENSGRLYEPSYRQFTL